MGDKSENKCESCAGACPSPAEIIQQVMRQRQQTTWSEMLEKAIENMGKDSLKECKGDRLCMAKKISRLLSTLIQSIKGWAQWMNFEKMDNLTKEEMEWLFPELKKVIIDFLKIDHDITKRKEDEAIKKQQEAVKKAKQEAKKREKKQPYVA